MYQNIRAALVTHYQGLSTVLPTQYENDSDMSGSFIKFDFMPNVSRVQSLGEKGQNRHTGLLQLLIHLPIEEGSGDSLEVAGNLVKHFQIGTSVSYNGTIVKIKGATAAPSYKSADNYITPVTVTWQSDIQR